MLNEYINNLKYGKISNNIDTSDYTEFRDEEEAKNWGMKHYSEWSDQYIKNMRLADYVIQRASFTSALECYCGYNYSRINEYLRFNSNVLSDYKHMSDILAITLTMAPRVPNNVVVYRLVCDEFINEIITRNKEESHAADKGFISTSLSKNIVNMKEAYTTHKSMLKIYVKANTIGVYVNLIKPSKEQELLLFPNGFFKLIKVPYEENNKIIYECELFYFNYLK